MGSQLALLVVVIFFVTSRNPNSSQKTQIWETGEIVNTTPGPFFMEMFVFVSESRLLQPKFMKVWWDRVMAPKHAIFDNARGFGTIALELRMLQQCFYIHFVARIVFYKRHIGQIPAMSLVAVQRCQNMLLSHVGCHTSPMRTAVHLQVTSLERASKEH